MKIVKSLRAAFAAAVLGTAALPAAAQDAPAVQTQQATETPAAVTLEPSKPATPASSQQLASYVDTAYRENVYKSNCPGEGGLSACLTEETLSAVKTRELQQVFMAASYGCRKMEGFENLGDRYNDFVLRHREELKSAYFEGRDQFWKVYGEGKPGNVHHDGLETGFANMYSGLSHREGYCAVATAALNEAIALEPGARVVREYAARILSQGPAIPARPAAPAPTEATATTDNPLPVKPLPAPASPSP